MNEPTGTVAGREAFLERPLRERLAGHGRLVAAEAWDVLSAKIVADAGYDLVTFATLPDLGPGVAPVPGRWIAGELLDVVFKSSGEVEIPIIVELPTGARVDDETAAWWARTFQEAGAAAVELGELGPQGSASRDASLTGGTANWLAGQLRAVRAACPDVVVVAGLSGATPTGGDARQRIAVYADAGADVVAVPGRLFEEIAAHHEGGTQLPLIACHEVAVVAGGAGARAAGPQEALQATDPDARAIEDLFSLGAAIVRVEGLHRRAYPVLAASLNEVRRVGSLAPVVPRMPTFDKVVELVGFDRFG